MIYVFSGSDRNKISQNVKKILGDGYEIFSGEKITAADLPNLFLGQTIFSKQRKILLKDVTPARGESSALSASTDDPYQIITQYCDTPHEIVIWETTVSQKKSFKDFAKNPKIKYQKIDIAAKVDTFKIFNIYNIAQKNGIEALKMLEEIKKDEDPFMFVGLLTSQAIKSYEHRQGAKEKRALKELSKLDILMKTTSFDQWLLISSFLLRLSSL